MNYQTIMWAEQKPDLYHGENCAQVRPRFECHADGDMESDFLDTFELSAAYFPPGTKVLVQFPCCPECGMNVESCKENDGCDFDWDEWRGNKYS